MAWRGGQGDLLAGGVASGALAAFVLSLGFDLWLAIVLAILIYAGLGLLLPSQIDLRPRSIGAATRAKRAMLARRAAFVRVQGDAAAIRQTVARIPKDHVRDRVLGIMDRIDGALMVTNEYGQDGAAFDAYDLLLTAFHPRLAEYVLVSRGGANDADPVIAEFEGVGLPEFEHGVEAVLASVHGGEVASLPAFDGVLESHLRDIPPPQQEPIAALDAPGGETETAPEPGGRAPDGPAPTAPPHIVAARRFGLTPREHEIVILLAESHPMMTNQEVAADRSISLRTVDNHVAKALDKLELRSRREIPAFAAKHGLLPPAAPSASPE